MVPDLLLRPAALALVAQRVAHEDVRIGELVVHAVVVGQVDHFHFRPAAAHLRRHLGRRPPEREAVPDADEQLGVAWRWAAHRGTTRKSRPVISAGCGTPRTPSSVGAMSWSAPPGRRSRRLSPVASTNGTGLVV